MSRARTDADAPRHQPDTPRTAAATERRRGPAVPVGERGRSALGAIDLLRSLAPDTAPLPDDPAVLRHLAAHEVADAPGRRHPDWLREACLARGLDDLAHHGEPPTRAETLRHLRRPSDTDTLGRTAERAYLHGIVRADDLLDHRPAALLLRLPHDWRGSAFVGAWRGSLAAWLERELGTDPDAWLRLAAASRGPATAHGADGGPEFTATWPELLARSRRDPHPPHAADDPLTGLCAVVDTPSPFAPTSAPRTPEAALALLARGNHLWAWPLGTLLCSATPEALAAVLPRLGPDGPWTLAAYLLRHRPTPRTPYAHLVGLRDPRALRVLSEESRWLDEESVTRLLDLADPTSDLAVLRTTGDAHVSRRIVGRPGALAARLAAELRADPSAAVPGGTHWLESAEPDLIELVFARSGKHLTLPQQLVGCLNLLRHGGRVRLASLVAGGKLGAAATRLCGTALATDDPHAPLAARAAKELAPARLVKRLRRAKGEHDTRHILDSTPGVPPWEVLEAEHRREPIPHWDRIVRHPAAPHAFRLRQAAHLPALSLRAVPLGPELTVARARHGVGGRFREPVDTLLDQLLRTGQLTGRDLVHEAAPAAVVLAYLGRARRRADAPAEVRTALRAASAVVRHALGDDAGAWQHVYARLTEQTTDPGPVGPVASLSDGC
ncbi:hypothetical protein ACIGBL_24180 [Streptomyces sp. NPDC085614]|uniref:hypothetical protein n=1 Tax=Streptomyces sp. NPDC085614 TaxID=3365733 RepID=UPI0037D70372